MSLAPTIWQVSLNETILVRCNDCTLPDVQSKTANKIAAENDISPRSVYYAEDFVDGVDAAEEVLPGVSKDILSGKIKPKQDEACAIVKAPAEKRKQMAKAIMRGFPKTQILRLEKSNIKWL